MASIALLELQAVVIHKKWVLGTTSSSTRAGSSLDHWLISAGHLLLSLSKLETIIIWKIYFHPFQIVEMMWYTQCFIYDSVKLNFFKMPMWEILLPCPRTFLFSTVLRQDKMPFLLHFFFQLPGISRLRAAFYHFLTPDFGQNYLCPFSLSLSQSLCLYLLLLYVLKVILKRWIKNTATMM